MKQLIRKVLPSSVLQTGLNIREKKKLALVSSLPFDPRCLKDIAELKKISSVFADPSIRQEWEKDHSHITSSFKDSYTFGGVNPGDRRALYYLIRYLGPEKVLEVGTHIGASTQYIACALRHVSVTASLTTVDILDVNSSDGPWKKYKLDMSPRNFAVKLGTASRIDFKISPSLQYLKKCKDKYDFIFLDGNHSAATVYEEVSASLPLLKPNGSILLHDYYPEGQALFPNGNVIFGPYLAMERITKEVPSISVMPLGQLPWQTKQGSHFTSLALVARTKS